MPIGQPELEEKIGQGSPSALNPYKWRRENAEIILSTNWVLKPWAWLSGTFWALLHPHALPLKTWDQCMPI